MKAFMLQISSRIYRALLYLYPAAFREAYGSEMLQVFQDSCRQVYHYSGGRGILRLWFAEGYDLVLNATAEHLTRLRSFRGLMDTVLTLSGLLALLGTWMWLWWAVWGVTIFMLIPWDMGIAPAGTFAAWVDNMIQIHDLSQLPGSITILFSLIVFLNGLARNFRLYRQPGRILWRYALSNLTLGIVALLLMGGCMLIARFFFPNLDVYEGDQSYGVALVYMGLILVPCLMFAPFRVQKPLFNAEKVTPDTSIDPRLSDA